MADLVLPGRSRRNLILRIRRTLGFLALAVLVAIAGNQAPARQGQGVQPMQLTGSPVIAEYSIPAPSGGLGQITSGADGALWFSQLTSTVSDIRRLATSGVVTNEYPTLTQNTCCDQRVTNGPDGNLWYTNGMKKGRL
jgi:streptogramin lyase